MNQEKLLREYVREILTEEDGGVSADSYGYSGGGAYGMSFGSQEDMYNTFIGPFVDVFKTAAGKSKEVVQKTKTLLHVALASTLTAIIPGFGYNYAEVFDDEKEKIEKIRSEYKDVYEKTDKALSSTDASMLAFLASPGLVLSTVAAKKGPGVAKDMLGGLTGGLSDELFDKVKEKAISAGRWSLGEDEDTEERRKKRKNSQRSGGKSPDDFFGESRLLEDSTSGEKKDITPEKIMRSKKFLNKAIDNPRVKELQRIATETYRESLQKIYSQAEDVLKKARTIDDIERMSKKKIPEAEKIKKLQGAEKEKAEKMLIDGVRKAMKEFYIKNLEEQVGTVLKTGIPEDAQYVKDFKAVIQKIKAL
jgi:hypothetical protein